MKRHKMLHDGLIGGGVGLMLLSLFYLGDQLFQLPFLPFDFFDWLARALPGELVTLGIDSIVDVILFLNLGESTSETAKLLEQTIALLIFVLLWVVVGWLIALVSQRTRFSAHQAALTAALLLFGALALILNVASVQQPLALAWQLILLLGHRLGIDCGTRGRNGRIRPTPLFEPLWWHRAGHHRRRRHAADRRSIRRAARRCHRLPRRHRNNQLYSQRALSNCVTSGKNVRLCPLRV